MNRRILISTISAIALFSPPALAQSPARDGLTAGSVRKLPRQKLSGPRFGFTTFTGGVADQRRGVGPSVSYNSSAETTTTSMVVAGGASIPFGEMFVPLNVAIALARGGPRVTTLVGWVIR